ncbi:MAG: C25 family cysteine peptidase, partial [Lentisphaeria bacterium]
MLLFSCMHLLAQDGVQTYQAENKFIAFNNDNAHQFTLQTPIQNGTARRSRSITTAGLYTIKNEYLGAHDKIYNAGIELPILEAADGNKFVFVRRINDFYNRNNYIWLGLLNIQIPPYLEIDRPNPIPFATQQNGWIEYDGYDGFLNQDGLTRIYRFHNDRNYTSNSGKSGGLVNGPNWYNGSVSEKNLVLDISTPFAKIDRTRMAKISICINDANTGNGAKRRLEVSINNDYDHLIILNYTGYGPKYFEVDVPASLFNDGIADGKNRIIISRNGTIEAPAPTTYNLDFVNLHLPIIEEENNGGYNLKNSSSNILFNIKVAPYLNKEFRVATGAKYAVDVTDMGKEALMPYSENDSVLTFDIVTNAEEKSVFVTSGLFTCDFDTPKVLDTIGLNGFDYLTIAPSDPNYFLKLSSDNILNHMKSTYNSNLYKTWTEYKPNRGSKTISDLHREDGLKPLNLKLEDIIDTYGCGLYSPHAIQQLIRTSNDIKYLLLLGMTTVDYKRQSVNQQLENESGYTFYMCYPGVPTGFIYHSQTGLFATDDIYIGNNNKNVSSMGDLKRSLSRILVYTDKELQAWLDKRFNFTPSDNLALWSGKDDSQFSFSEKQSAYRYEIPSVFLNHNELSTNTLQNSIKAATNGGVNTHIYQGHGVGYQLDNTRFLHTDDEVVTAPANYIWGTCHAGDYVKTGAVPKLAGTLTNLSYSYTNAKRSDSTDIINTIDQNTDSTKGAVNIISATSYAAAYWEDSFIGKCFDLMNEDTNITWGEMMLHAKSRVFYGVNAMMYHLFGDPALKVRGDDRRTITLLEDKYAGKQLNVLLKGNWKQTKPLASKINYTIDYVTTNGNSGTVNGSFDISQFTHQELLKGAVATFEVNNVPNQSSFTIAFYSEFDLKIQDGSNATQIIKMDWAKTPDNIILDIIAPNDFSGISPTNNQTISPLDITLVANSTTDSLSGIAGYKFILTHNKTNKVFTSGETLLNESTFTFHPLIYDTTGSVKLRDCTGAFTWSCIAYDNANNQKVAAPPFA